MDSKYNNFLENINKKYESFKEDILINQNDENFCNNLSNNNKYSIFKYQEFLFNYMKDLNDYSNKNFKEINNRGLLIYHGLGTGKTISGILLSESCRDYKLEDKNLYDTKDIYKRKVILMIPANLFFDPWIKEISSYCFSNCELRDEINKILNENKNISDKKLKDIILNKLKDFDYYIIHYNANSLKGGYKDKLLNIPNRKNTNNKYINKISNSINPFDDSVIIIDESHNLINMITNKMKNNEKVELYEDLFYSKNSRVILLSGTPIINDIYEIALTANIIRGYIENDNYIKFEEDYNNFNELFVDNENNIIKNKNMLKRRLNGLISYNKGISKNVFAQKIQENIYIPLVKNQFIGYEIAEKITREISGDNIINEYNNKTFLPKKKASNVVFPSYIFNQTELNKKNLTKNKKLIKVSAIENKNRLLDISMTTEYTEKIIKILDNDNKPLNINNDLYEISKKVYHIIKKINDSNGPVLVYSGFEGLFGIKFIEEVLKQNNYELYNGKNSEKISGTFMKWTGKERNNKYKNIFNSLQNKDGKIIKVFLMTMSGKEGINLLSIRQIHILEPWWNNVVIKQVEGRGIRICSHNHIEKHDFIDFRFKNELKIINNRIINIFRYYGFLDLRYLEKDKITIKNMMKNRSIDFQIKKIADKKEIFEKQILDILKEISIDCDINYNRNDNEVICFIDKKHNDYFKSWNIQDDEFLLVKKTFEKIKINQNLYYIDQFNNIYKIKNKNIVNIDINNLEKDLLLIGKYINNQIEYINEYYKNEDLIEIKKDTKIKNYLLYIIKYHNIDIKNSIDYYSIFDKNLIILSKMFNDITLFMNKTKKVEKLLELNNNIKLMNKEDYKYSDILFIDFFNLNNLEEINDYHNQKYIFVLNVDSTLKDKSIILSKNIYYKKYNILLIFNNKIKNDFYKLIKKLDLDNYKKMKLLKDLEKLGINNLDDLIKIINNKDINDIENINIIKMKLGINTIFDVKNFDECMKILLKDIKKTKEYKQISKKYKKSKLKKKELCETINFLNK